MSCCLTSKAKSVIVALSPLYRLTRNSEPMLQNIASGDIVNLMAHERTRQVIELYQKLAAYSPIVGIFGHRQVGKTTLACQLSKHYVTFDDKATRQLAEGDPALFIKERAKKGKTLVIDECQMVPDIFPALKEFVRTHKEPGQFLLTGSVRFTSGKAVQESLAGRIATIELLPMVLSELENRPLSNSLGSLMDCSQFNEQTRSFFLPLSEQRKTVQHLDKYLENGGLPGTCFLRNTRLRNEAVNSILRVILDRDLRTVIGSRLSFETLLGFLSHIAKLGFRPYQAAAVSTELGLSPKTQKSLLFALESIFLIRRISQEGKKGFLTVMEDQFEERLLSETVHPRNTQMLGAFYRNARAQFQYRLGHPTRWTTFGLNTGATVPLVLHSEGKALGFAMIDKSPTVSQSRSTNSFLRRYPQAKMVYLMPNFGETTVIDSRTLQCPIAAVL